MAQSIIHEQRDGPICGEVRERQVKIPCVELLSGLACNRCGLPCL